MSCSVGFHQRPSLVPHTLSHTHMRTHTRYRYGIVVETGVHFHPQLFSQRHTLQRKTCLLIVNHKSSDSESPFACVPMVNRVSATSPMVITDLLVVIVGPQKKKKGRVILLHKGLCLSFGAKHAGGAPSLRQGSGGEVGRVGEFL